MIYLVLAISGMWTFFALAVLRNVLAAPTLPTQTELPASPALPEVSVVIAARNEGARLEESIERLLGQQGVSLEVIVVNDRSSDDTAAILSRLAARHANVLSVHVEQLPAGWLGKCNALAQGAALAHSPWLLFADGDIHMAEDVIARAIATAEREGAAHLTLYPGINCRSLLTQASLLAWGQFLMLYAPAAQINADRGRKAIGVGAFNLVRRDAYLAIGGHEPLRMEIIDDVKLGLLLRRGGFRARIYSGFREVEAEWAQSVVGLIRLLEKNWFAGVNYSVWEALGTMLSITSVWIGAFLGPLLVPGWGWLSVAAIGLTIVPALVQARRSNWPLASALLVPLGFLMFVVAGIHSTWKTLRQGGVRWRDTFYPLAELRAGLVR